MSFSKSSQTSSPYIVTALKHELADYNQIEELFHVILIVKILEFSNCSLTIITDLLNYFFVIMHSLRIRNFSSSI
jgi:hypothetical protein